MKTPTKQSMVIQEEGCQPTVVTYNTLIDVYGKMGRWEDAVKVLSDMVQQVNASCRSQMAVTGASSCTLTGRHLSGRPLMGQV